MDDDDYVLSIVDKRKKERLKAENTSIIARVMLNMRCRLAALS